MLVQNVQVAAEHVMQATAMAGNLVLGAKISQRVVAGFGGGCDNDPVYVLTSLCALHDVPDHRVASEGLQHFAGQAAGGHARLDDGDGRFGGRTRLVAVCVHETLVLLGEAFGPIFHWILRSGMRSEW